MNDIENHTKALYMQWLQYWNARDAKSMAALVADKGNITGFDGSQMNGPAEAEASLKPIFANHPTATYLTIVREVRQLSDDIVMLRATAAMVPPGKADINPAVNAIQTLVAKNYDGTMKIELFQNTPAAFHGRPELAEQLSNELRGALRRE